MKIQFLFSKTYCLIKNIHLSIINYKYCFCYCAVLICKNFFFIKFKLKNVLKNVSKLRVRKSNTKE